jgi:Complex I intermediate-associated protein 30 (CIA30)
MGGLSTGHLTREVYQGRISNVLRGMVRLENNGGFIQMATNLVRRNQAADTCISVDASDYDGVEIDVHNGMESPTGFETFNLQYVVVFTMGFVFCSLSSLNNSFIPCQPED